MSGDWGKLEKPNLAWMFPIKCYWMLQKTRVTAFTVSELLRENQQWEEVKLTPLLPPAIPKLRLIHRQRYLLNGPKNLSVTEDCNLNYVFQIISDIIGVDILFLILYISIANERILLWWQIFTWSFLSKFSKDDWLSLYTILRALSCKWFIRFFYFLPQNIQTSEQYPNCDSMKYFIKVLRRSREMNLQILVKAFNFLPAYLHWFKTYSTKWKFLSVIIPNSFVFCLPRF